jgi:hypothetical protein
MIKYTNIKMQIPSSTILPSMVLSPLLQPVAGPHVGDCHGKEAHRTSDKKKVFHVISTPTVLVVPADLPQTDPRAKLSSPCQEEINETQKIHKDGAILPSPGSPGCDLRHILL